MTEFRPGWVWERDFEAFNRSMTDPVTGGIRFDGPFPKVDEWVALSRGSAADYHAFQVKWHDGICYFDTATTRWRTPEDHAGRFAALSREARIPFLFYYSSVFDHNPDFDAIQPNRNGTISFVGARDNAYTEYLVRQYRELLERYDPDGMWIDWFWPVDRSTEVSREFLVRAAPDKVLTFNISNYFPGTASGLDYTSGEIHGLDGPLLRRIEGLPFPNNCWTWANYYRTRFAHPWELFAPAGRWWSDPTLRDDPHELLRMAAIVMACGGKFLVGAAATMAGGVLPEHERQIRLLGDWYGPRKHLFTGAVPSRRWGRRGSRARTSDPALRVIGARTTGGTLLHVVNMTGRTGPATLRVELPQAHLVRSVRREPDGRQVRWLRSGRHLDVWLDAEDVDPVDTVLALSW